MAVEEMGDYCKVLILRPGDEVKIFLLMVISLRNEIKYESSSHSLGVTLALLAES